jgi:glutathione peroxidase
VNYPGLRYLYNKYKDQGFTLLAFPSNQFGGQAPGTSDEEREYAYYKFGFEFPVFDKIDVKGPAMSPVYDFLKSKQPGEIEWNYVKFLVNRDGVPVRRFKPGFDPVDFEEDLVATLEGRPLPAKQRVYLGAP